MTKDEIMLHDWQRILMGEVPGIFFLEIILRTIVVYAILMLSFRMMGNRMASRLNRIEQASLVTLAAAIGVPIQSPERGLIPAVIIALIVVGCGRLIARRSSRNENFERASQGKIDTLIENSVLLMQTIRKTTLTRERVFAQLRSKGILHLGEVKRFYFESNGSFTLVKTEDPEPGLAIIPEHDRDFLSQLPRSGQKMVCSCCGKGKGGSLICDNCHTGKWEPAIITTHQVSLDKK